MVDILMKHAEALVSDHRASSHCTVHSGVATNFSWGFLLFAGYVQDSELIARVTVEFYNPTLEHIKSGRLPWGAEVGVTKITLRGKSVQIDVAWFLDEHTALLDRVQKKVNEKWGAGNGHAC